MKYTNTCSYHKCNNIFSTNRKDKKYCSEKCNRNDYKSRKWKKIKEDKTEDKICLSCKTSFKTSNSNKVYCSSCQTGIRKEQSKKWQEENNKQYKDRKNVYTQKDTTKKKKKKDYISLNNSTKENSIEEGVYYTLYTLEEDQFLIDNWDNYTKKELAEALSRSYSSICSRYNKLIK